MGHVSIRNPLQAPKERSCGISIPSPSLGSAKRDRPSSSTSYGMRQSPFGELYGWRCRTYPQLRCFAACSGFHDIGPAPRNPQLIIFFLRSRGRRRHRIQARYTYARSDPGLRRRTRWWCPRGRCGGRARCPQAKQSRRPRERASGCPW